MIKFDKAATIGFDRAIAAMRRENGGREASDSKWEEDYGIFDTRIREFVIGPKDKAECMRMIATGYRPFMNFIGIWAHIEAPAEWWPIISGYFIGCNDVDRTGGSKTRSVFTSYGHLRNLMEFEAEISDSPETLEMLDALKKAVEDLPESWLLLEELEEGRA